MSFIGLPRSFQVFTAHRLATYSYNRFISSLVSAFYFELITFENPFKWSYCPHVSLSWSLRQALAS